MASYTKAANLNKENLPLFRDDPSIIEATSRQIVRWADLESQEQMAYMEAMRLAKERTHATYGSNLSAPEIALRDGRLSTFIEQTICFDLNRHVSFHTSPWWREIYDCFQTARLRKVRGVLQETVMRSVLLMCARQVFKSTFLGNLMLALTARISNTTALYVGSAALNMLEFADERIDNPIRVSPKLKAWIGKFISYNRYLKRLARNNSRLVMRSAHLDASRVRGIPADMLLMDEIQNFIREVIDVILATLNASEMQGGPIRVFAGTPLTMDNPIQRFWVNDSTQNYWMMKCSRCNKEQSALRDQCGPKGLICSKCGKALDPFSGRWVRHGRADAGFEGFHISRPLSIYVSVGNLHVFDNRWKQFYHDVNNPNALEATVQNEIFGISFDSGRKPITEDQLRKCSHPGLHMNRLAPRQVINNPTWPVFMGVDWGQGDAEGAYTVVTLGYMVHEPEVGDVFRIFYCHRYMGMEADPIYVKNDLAKLISDNNVTICFCDAGFGWGIIEELRLLVDDGLNRVIPLRYTSQSQIISFDDAAHCFTAARTRWMAKVFNLLLRQRIQLPCWDEFAGEVRSNGGFAADVLSIFADRSMKLKEMQFNHSEPDDYFHALLYAATAKMWFYGELSEFAMAS